MIKSTIATALLVATGILSVTGVQAAGVRSGMALACENGATYPFLIGAVSDAGEVVTGYIDIGRSPVHVRLVPMGDGYRYAGLGLWLDGKEDVAILYFGKSSAVNCTVVPAADVAIISAKG